MSPYSWNSIIYPSSEKYLFRCLFWLVDSYGHKQCASKSSTDRCRAKCCIQIGAIACLHHTCGAPVSADQSRFQRSLNVSKQLDSFSSQPHIVPVRKIFKFGVLSCLLIQILLDLNKRLGNGEILPRDCIIILHHGRD
jgi:hypothetical protein